MKKKVIGLLVIFIIFTAMEFLEGKTLKRKIYEEGGLTLHECVHIMMRIINIKKTSGID
jgi:hypothetical protein